MTDEWSGSERRRTPDLSNELRGVKVGLEELGLAVKLAFPEDRMREIVAYEQSRSRHRMVAAILGPVLLAFIIVGFSSYSNGHTLNEAKVAADFVRQCLQHPEKLSAEERAANCGGEGNGTSKAVAALIQFQKCALLIQPADRTDDNMNLCVVHATNGLGGG